MNHPKSALLAIDRYFGLRHWLPGWTKRWAATEKYQAQVLEDCKALYDSNIGYEPWIGPSVNERERDRATRR